MKIGVLTSSRADYGIYLPLLKKLFVDDFFNTEIIAFGTHLSKSYGSTINNIIADGFSVKHRIKTVAKGDKPADISQSIGETIKSFSDFWEINMFDLVLALGDRYEMFAAVMASVPFHIKIAHIHGGETTTGAIDNVFRHSITHASSVHFASAEDYKNRIIELTENKKGVYNVGSLSFDNLKTLKLLSDVEFFNKYKIDLKKPSILITFHPETVSFEKNGIYIKEIIKALKSLNSYQQIITMPNADTMGSLIRKEIVSYAEGRKDVHCVENFGTVGYLSCMKHCSFMLGNTSSGFIEAGFFPKPVINLGDRQKGRIVTKNIINSDIDKETILYAVKSVEHLRLPKKIEIYGSGNTASKIIRILKKQNSTFQRL
jgi:GDP/UDP-N,N'-diacetylbacillosamine 2-epimerase (hydrolysing)